MTWKQRLPILLIFLAMFIVAFFSFTSSPSDKKQILENKKTIDQLKKKWSVTPTITPTPTTVFRNFNPQPTTIQQPSSGSTQKETIRETNTIREFNTQSQPTSPQQPTPAPQPTSIIDPICNFLPVC